MEQEENYYHLELPIEAVRVIHTGLTQQLLNGLVVNHKSKKI